MANGRFIKTVYHFIERWILEFVVSRFECKKTLSRPSFGGRPGQNLGPLPSLAKERGLEEQARLSPLAALGEGPGGEEDRQRIIKCYTG